MTDADFDEFHRILRRCWSVETSPQWLPENPARGQCAVTALVFCDHFGGEILKTLVENEWHFYNRVFGSIPSTRDEALAGTAPERYRALADRVRKAVAPQ